MIDLHNIERVYVDSNIFIYFAEFENAFGNEARTWLDAILGAGIVVIVSRLTLLECIYRPAREKNHRLTGLYRAMLVDSPEIEMIELEPVIVDAAAMKGGALGLKLQDAIHYTTALHLSCDLFLTNDRRFRSTPDMRVVLLSPMTS